MELDKLSQSDLLLEIGKKLKRLRKKKNYSIVKLSEDTGINRMTISNMEKGSNFSIDSLVRILKVYKVLDRLNDFLEPVSLSPKEIYLNSLKNK